MFRCHAWVRRGRWNHPTSLQSEATKGPPLENPTPPPGQSPRLFGRSSRIAATAALCLGLASGGYAIASAASSQSSTTTDTTTAPAPAVPSGHFDGPGDRGHFGRGLALDRAALESAIAGAIGITPDALQTERQSGKTLAEIAVAHGKTAADVVAAITTALTKAIDDSATKGTITADQATALKAHTADLANHLVNDADGGPGGRFGGHRHGPGMGHGLLGEARGKVVTAVATALGISEADLKTELDAGSTLAQIAVKHGKTAADVTKVVTDSATAQIEAAVTSGKLTADQATKLKAHLPQLVDRIVNDTRGGDRHRGGGKCDHGDHQQNGQGPTAGDDTTTTTTQAPAT